MPKELVAIINPTRRRRRTSGKRRRARRNPGLLAVGANPRRRRRRRGVALSSPKWTYRRRRSRRNPFGGGGGFKIGIDSVAFTALGAIGSKMIPGFIPFLKDKNKGMIGYAIQGGAGFALSMALDKLLKQKKAAQFVLLGTGVSIALGLLDDFWFKRNVSVKGLGFYPDEQLNNIDLSEYEIVQGLDGGMGDYVLEGVGEEYDLEGNDTPIDEMAGLAISPMLSRRLTATQRIPFRAAVATRPQVAVGAGCGDRFSKRW